MTHSFRLFPMFILAASLGLGACVPAGGMAPAASPEDAMAAQETQDREDVNRIWNKALPKLQKALEIKEKIPNAPRFTLFGKSKKNLQEDFAELLDGLSILLSERSLKEIQEDLADQKKRIKGLREDIAGYREAKVGAPTEHMVKTTRSGYDKKIAGAERKIVAAEEEIRLIRVRFANDLRRYGLKITEEQAEVLLARVDGDDIIQMAVVFDTMKDLTVQLMDLTRESGEDLEHAKRYYGMHVVLLELIVHMQDTYIMHVDKRYLPKLNAIVKRAQEIKREARRELKREKSKARRKIYQSNIKAHDLTLKTAALYGKSLVSQKKKIAKARAKVVRDLKASENTFKTVMVSADLLGIIKTSHNAFNALMNIQAPELEPFKNLEMRKKFQELSNQIAQ